MADENVGTERQQSAPSPFDRAFLTRDSDAGTLLLVRHGQQQWPDQQTSTVGEWVDPPLSELGERQAEAVGHYLAEEPITAVYSSTLKRAYATGKAIADQRDCAIETIEQLEEIRLYGKLSPDVRAVDALGERTVAGARERFVRSRRWDSFPESEPSVDFRRRVGIAIEGIVASHPGETVAVACHGGVINAYLADVLGVESDMFFRPSHASIQRLRYRDSVRVIETLNERVFLQSVGLLSC